MSEVKVYKTPAQVEHDFGRGSTEYQYALSQFVRAEGKLDTKSLARSLMVSILSVCTDGRPHRALAKDPETGRQWCRCGFVIYNTREEWEKATK